MHTTDFDYILPDTLIAQEPPPLRGSSRMLVLRRENGLYTDERFTDLPNYLRDGDLLILNDSRVLPSRLFAVRARSSYTQLSSPDPSGRIEVLLTRQLGPEIWTALVRPARKVHHGEYLNFYEGASPAPVLQAEVTACSDDGERTLRFEPTTNFEEVLHRIGYMPLPPYIRRSMSTPKSEGDRVRYQTVYAAAAGSAAAPTAGLHFTPETLSLLKAKGVQIESLTLHVGLGTFKPVRAKRLEDIRLHAERYTMPCATAQAINSARKEGRRIIAAGTTTTRTLEHCATLAPEMYSHTGETRIFLSPGHRFRIVDGLLTNFHLPQSTLLMLVSAFAGRTQVLKAYAHAVSEEYRFFSYGDCMLIL